MIADWRTVERFPGQSDRLDYVLDGDEERFSVTVVESMSAFDETDIWDVVVRGVGTPYIQEIEGLDVAKRIGRHLYVELLPQHRAANVRRRRREKKRLAEIAAREEVERPEREKAQRDREARLAVAPVEQVAKCPECGHVDEDDAFGERGYECSTDGSTGRGEEGRRCDRCNKYRGRVSDLSCPECEAPLEEIETVSAKEIGGRYYEIESTRSASEIRPEDSYGWALTGQIRSRNHIAKIGEFQNVALCGVGIDGGTVETRPITLNLCPGCAREARKLGLDPEQIGIENDLV